MDIVKKIKEHIVEICEKLDKMDDYVFHISIVETLSTSLARKYGANEEIVRMAALLHDIGRIKFGPENHEETGAIEAEKILKELKVEAKKIEKIKECIKEHRHSKPTVPISLEAKVLKIADAYSHFKKPIEIVFMRVKEGASIEESLKWMKEKLERDLKFLREMKSELEIEDIVKECEKIYECFSCLIG